jgi:two-component system response regulator
VTSDIRTILLAEDNSNDAELTLAAFRENHLLNPIVVVRDGALALDYCIGGRPSTAVAMAIRAWCCTI